MVRLWDISPPISPATPAFPGDTSYQQRWVAEIGPGCPVNVSAITMSPHLGAHADAPLHYGRNAPAIGLVALDPYLGPCRVIHAVGCGPLIAPAHLQHAAAGLPPRVLVRTCRQAPTTWSPNFTAFAPG
ncbi:MAG TPA: cyclase family protein, partial [Vicinamibacterales bacterium]|nr:cyclase family protein [Vicinamibacterales bacterium]